MENNCGLQGIVERVRQMEQYMDGVTEVLKNNPKELRNNDELRKKVEILTDYMDSGRWLADYEADERGELPASLKRGVLSQDGLYNLVCDVEAFYRETMKYEITDSLSDFSINEMQQMQKTLQEHYKSVWEPIGPETGQNKLLWMIGEIGEVIDIVKKNGGINACSNAELRKDLVEELADVLMYYNDVLLCYDISAEELKQAYTGKFERNMKRWKAE